jgi:hypothetical protein
MSLVCILKASLLPVWVETNNIGLMRTGFELGAGNIMVVVAAVRENVSFTFTMRAMTGLH